MKSKKAKPSKKGSTRKKAAPTKPDTKTAQEPVSYNQHDHTPLAGNPATISRKRTLLTALEKCFGIVTPACQMAGIHRDTHYVYMNEDPLYAQAVKDIAVAKKDFAEYQLFRLATQGVPQCVMEVNKKINRDRGYGDKLDIGVGLNPSIGNKKIFIPHNGRDEKQVIELSASKGVDDNRNTLQPVRDSAKQGTDVRATFSKAS